MPGRFSPFRPEWAKAPGLVATAVAAGLIGWSGISFLLPFAMVFPALWAAAPTRRWAALVSAGYFLAASRGLPQGAANFYDDTILSGVILWFAASTGFVLVHTLFWTDQTGRKRSYRYGVAAIVMSVPPFGIIGWAHPITGAGFVFSGWGWFGLASAALSLAVMTTRAWPIAALVVGGMCLWSTAVYSPPKNLPGWMGVDSNFRGQSGVYADFQQQVETVAMVRDHVRTGAAVVVLPEGALGIWTPTVAAFWHRALQDLPVIVIAGAVTMDGSGYDNVMIEISGDEFRVLYRERMPVPVSMWRPWSALFGEPMGARAYFFDNPMTNSAGVKIAPLICYEQLLVWPIIQSMLYGPEMIVATGNGWWTENTDVVAIQRASAEAWARLFDLPITIAFNS